MPDTKTVRVENHHVGDETDSVHEVNPAFAIAIQIVYYLAGVVSLLLGLRFVLILLGANNTGVVNWVYQITQPFVSPFYGIFGNTILYDSARIEWESLIAILAVGIIAYIVAGFLRLFR